ncbi:MAG: J domain-containing protein, partial [Pseudomonadales bacterium]|nr:J domain-containing protein [Pseudomonadales bacterium]
QQGFGDTGFREFGFGRQRQRRGRDVRYRITIPLEEAWRGGSSKISLENPDGTTRKINVRIPAGITHGKELRLKGQGQAGSERGLEGDLYLEVEIAPHALFELEGKDVTLTLPVAPWEAALGGEVEIPTLGGSVNMKIPANSQSGKRLRLKGRGLPGSPAGDQFVILKIVNPAVKSDEDRKFFEKMRDKMEFDPRAKLKESRHA